MGFQFLEEEFNLPACRMDLGDRVGVERYGGDVGQVEPILGAPGESGPDQATRRRTMRRVPAQARCGKATSLSTSRVSRCSPVGDLVEPFVLKLHGAPAPLAMDSDDTRIGVGRQAGEEVAAVSVEAIEERVAETDQVEEQPPHPHPRPHPQRAVVFGALAAYLDRVRTAPCTLITKRSFAAAGLVRWCASREDAAPATDALSPPSHRRPPRYAPQAHPHHPIHRTPVSPPTPQAPLETSVSVPHGNSHGTTKAPTIGPSLVHRSGEAPPGCVPPSGPEPRNHTPQQRAGTDLARAAHRCAFPCQACELRLRQQTGQCLANANTLPYITKPC